MPATTVWTGIATKGVSSTFTVGPVSRTSITLKGAAKDIQRGSGSPRVEATLRYSSNGEYVMMEGKPIVLCGLNNAYELLHAGSFQLEVLNPDGMSIEITTE